MHKRTALAISFGSALAASAAFAQAPAPDNLEKLQFKSTGASLEIPAVPQDRPPKRRPSRRSCRRSSCRRASRSALRHRARRAPHGGRAAGRRQFVGTRKNKVYAVTDRDKDRVADEVKVFAPRPPSRFPTASASPGRRAVRGRAEPRARVPGCRVLLRRARRGGVHVVKQGELIPRPRRASTTPPARAASGRTTSSTSRSASRSTCRRKDKLDALRKNGIGGIIRMDQDGKNREVYATGVRNSVGMDFNPKDKTLWFTDNQVDGMGDDMPPGELNRATKAGQNFGFPWYGGGKVRTAEYKDDDAAGGRRASRRSRWRAHAADLGMIVLHGQDVPGEVQGGIFTAQHGSWNRTKPVGARIMFTTLKDDGTADKTEASPKAG